MPSFFIPARSSRHRTACFALFKALIQRARLVPLPDHVTYPLPDKPHVSPIVRFIRHSFQQNRGDTSPRLVLAALNSGYKFLELLDAARTAGSPEHASIVDYLERKPPPKRPPPPLRRQKQLAAKQARKEQRKKHATDNAEHDAEHDAEQYAEHDAEHDDGARRQPPVLSRRVIPGSERLAPDGSVLTYVYEYVPSADSIPLAELPGGLEHGRRFVPRLVTESSGIPFLRMGKPQSPKLSRALRFKIAKRRARTALATSLLADQLPEWEAEDVWETNLAKALVDAGEPGARTFAHSVEHEPTFRASFNVGINYLHHVLNVESADMLLRSKAFLQIVDRERELAAKEEAERQEREKESAL